MNILTPRKALNKAYLKQKVNRDELETFKKNLLLMLNEMNEGESEEYHKNLLSAFLNDTWYKGNHFINTRERTDLVIHSEKTSESKPAVLIETKKPGNKSEMPSKENLNAKAVHELIRYYLHERIDNGNISVKHLIVTDLNKFFIFNENDFDKYIYRDKQIRNAYENYKNSGKDTTFFYQSIAKPLLDKIQDKFTFTWFEVKSIKKYLKSTDPEKDKKLIPYYKLLSPAHLLKQPFANDSNTLDRNFYHELLHIIGLKEVKKGSQKLIQRAPENERNPGSLIENAITILKSEGILDFFTKKKEYGNDKDEQTFNIALELVITWINRILFLKLLEAQLVRYNRNDESFKFLNINTLPDYDALNKLFFQVLAVRPEERNDQVREAFSKIPYLNSSLFDPNELEGHTIRISNLEDEYELPYLKQTILKDNKGKRRTGKLDSLQYLFEFLDAYDFASEGSEDIQEENKNLINASVLGLIFEKINGYKDGSFFTPGFITEYMARETIRRAVVQKFNEEKGWKLDDFEALKEHIDISKEGREEANRIINSLKVCDPAVGSGHFLVSALNEMIALKSELKVLSYRDGKRMKLYAARVENDELIIEDEDEGGIFEYGLSKQGTIIPEKQAVQEAIFHEKQTIIENCLFGVDINANSVKICRLRLWIELLKNAYYHPAAPQSPESEPPRAAPQSPEGEVPTLNQSETGNYGLELQTLPNIDINIKTGNSLINRFSLNASLANALKRSNWRIEDYRKFVRDYKNARSREEKQGLQEIINEIKKDFRTEINRDNPKQKKLNKLSQELYNKYTGNKLFEEQLTKKQQQDRARLEKEITKLQKEINDLKNNEVYRNAFEWRFEFPEVLDDEGNFLGFDVVIGNPPYLQLQTDSGKLANIYRNLNFESFASTGDIYCLFYEKGFHILREEGVLTFITSSQWMKAAYGKYLRKYLLKQNPEILILLGPGIFETATVDTNLLIASKSTNKKKVKGIYIKDITELNKNINDKMFSLTHISENDWSILSSSKQELKRKINNKGKPLSDWDIQINFGIKTGYNKAFIIDKEKRDELVNKDSNSNKVLKPVLRGREIKPYITDWQNLFIVYIPWHYPLHDEPIKGSSTKAEKLF
ncbi:MAG: DUF7149 domain-containing protein, partial [bacterium]